MLKKMQSIKSEYSTFLDQKLMEFNEISEQLKTLLNSWSDDNLRKDKESKEMIDKMGLFLGTFQKFVTDTKAQDEVKQQ